MPPAELVIRGRIVVAALPDRVEVAEAIGIGGGRVVSVGMRSDVVAPGARIIDVGHAAVIPGLTDSHVHLVGLARARESVLLEDARDAGVIADRLASAIAASAEGTWITGRGWNEARLTGAVERLEHAARGRAALLMSHDGHSAWASAVARGLAGISAGTPDPPGGRIERDPQGEPTGILRETATDLVAPHVARLQGERLRNPLNAAVAELSALGITGVCEAGDSTAANGVGADAALGDSYSSLSDLADVVDARLCLTLGIPADAIPAAAARGLRTGAVLDGRRSMRFGWAKEYTDGTLGSGTAALFEPGSCGGGDTGILRVSPDRLDADFAMARAAGIGLALHAIGDRAVATVLDAVERAGPRVVGAPHDRIEHIQLMRPADAPRFAAAGITASIQPIHAAADRDLVEACWDGRQHDAYAWRSLASAGARLVAGSDAPIESVNPWHGMYAAVHRCLPGDGREDWRIDQALSPTEALAAYTSAPALAIGAADEGHLRVGARADLAILSVDLDVLLRADAALADVRSVLTVVAGREVSRS